MTWVMTNQCQFYLHEGENLLDGLLRTGHQPEYQCKEGYCGSCRLRLLSQSEPVTYDSKPLAMVEDDEILPCCCAVQGVIKLDF